ncbi:MAG: hypothetical protein A3C16_00550 [Candidatus Sungbacteria bacterium RIFCSPHIGHO2_02_FULL_51_29]|uniref:Uncharacterized protein n=1 Tax=Candidatus Sungbacteria bacterium RIFCSPHIGHO2_02_FULL_51_29 TaxID=1802273 RepID=A0A1G2KSS8_9BACT|nr:MAG: hypothetical protein A3C16_00550 [Candidatus Sungbacteria bacterium RIFCSPHIGHO2_02_FULL_51_29]
MAKNRKPEIVLSRAQKARVIGLIHSFPATAPGHGGTQRRCVEARCITNNGTLAHFQDRAEVAKAFVLAADAR